MVRDSCPSDLWSPDNGPIGGHEEDAHDEWNAPDIKLETRCLTRLQRAHDEKPHHNSEDESHDYVGCHADRTIDDQAGIAHALFRVRSGFLRQRMIE